MNHSKRTITLIDLPGMTYGGGSPVPSALILSLGGCKLLEENRSLNMWRACFSHAKNVLKWLNLCRQLKGYMLKPQKLKVTKIKSWKQGTVLYCTCSITGFHAVYKCDYALASKNMRKFSLKILKWADHLQSAMQRHVNSLFLSEISWRLIFSSSFSLIFNICVAANFLLLRLVLPEWIKCKHITSHVPFIFMVRCYGKRLS